MNLATLPSRISQESEAVASEGQVRSESIQTFTPLSRTSPGRHPEADVMEGQGEH